MRRIDGADGFSEFSVPVGALKLRKALRIISIHWACNLAWVPSPLFEDSINPCWDESPSQLPCIRSLLIPTGRSITGHARNDFFLLFF